MAKFIVGICAIVCLSSCDSGPADTTTTTVGSKYLNDYLIETLNDYPPNGSITQMPAKDRDKSLGLTRTIDYAGSPALKSKTPSQSYCSAIVFEVYARTMAGKASDKELYLGFDRPTFFQFRKEFYGVDGNSKTLVHALTSHGLAEEVKDVRDAMPGDLVQFWRNNGTGHSVVFMGGKMDQGGNVVSIKYWSIQQSGLGMHEELVGSEKRQIDRARIYVARAFAPK